MKRVFWDIETSPNIMFSWRAGYKLTLDYHNIIRERAIICICWKWEGQKTVHSLTWDDGDDKEMLIEFSKVIEKADELVAHNGDKFDMKWFNTRHLFHGLDPIPPTKTADTLKIARSKFYFNSNRLDYLAQLLLDGDGKVKTDFNLWKTIVLNNDPTSMRKMVTYCKKDVVLLERVWEKLSAYTVASEHAAVAESGHPMDRWKCAHCGSTLVKRDKKRITAKGMVNHTMVCAACHRYYSIPNVAYEWYLAARRRGDCEAH